MEIDITETAAWLQPQKFSACAGELGEFVGQITWAAAMGHAMLLPDEFDDWEREVASMGAWPAEERALWNKQVWNALLVQCISGDTRELRACCGEPFDWHQAQVCAEEGAIKGNIYPHNGRVYYQVGV